MTKITARITMSVELPEEEFDKIITAENKGEDVEVEGNLLWLFKHKGYIDEEFGDSYIPGPWAELLYEKRCDV